MDTSSPQPVAEWQAPRWSTSSHQIAGGVWWRHAADRAPSCLDDEGQPRALAVSITQLDTVDVEDVTGRVTVARRGEPLLAIDGLQLTLDQATRLGVELGPLVEWVRRTR